MSMNSIVKFVLNNFKLNEYERQELRCKDRITNKWGELILPDGKTIKPKKLQLVRIFHECGDMYCREPIEEHTICAFYVVMHEGELYYLDVDNIIELQGDMWEYGSNMNNETWNSYIVPDMTTCNHHLYPLKHSSDAAYTWCCEKKTTYMKINEASEKGYLENMM